MSRARELARRLRSGGAPDDTGFSMVEVIVAMMLLALASAAVVPVIVVGGRAAVSARLEAQAKHYGQERLEQMRQLPFHVTRANGQYVDLLDRYYPNRVPATGTGTGWVSAATGGRRPDEPTTGAMYRLVIAPTSAQPTFTQVVTSQFLDLNRVPVAESRFATYDSQVGGGDVPPTKFLGVTVITTWTDGGTAKTSRLTTQISAEGRPGVVLTSQARATAVRISSSGADEAALTAEAASVAVDGQLSDSAVASALANAGRVTRTGATTVQAGQAGAVAPAGAQPGLVDSAPAYNDPDCGDAWGSFGSSRVDQVTSSVTGALPLVPAAVGSGTTPAARTTASLLAGSGGACGAAFAFDNDTENSISRLRLDRNYPLVTIPQGVAGTPAPAQSSGWTNATTEVATPRFVRAGASASTAQSIELFRTDFSGGQPLVRVQLVSSSIECDSRTPGAATASYRVTIDYRDVSGIRLPIADFTWSSAAGPVTDPLAGVNLATKLVGYDGATPLSLADYIGSWKFATSLFQGATNGISGLDAALQITTVPLRSSATSSAGVTVGALSCAAADSR